jgi:hypothetical protein
MQSVDDLPAASPATGPALVPCPAPSAAESRLETAPTSHVVRERLEVLKAISVVVLAAAATALAALYPAGGPVQAVGRSLSMLLAALLWFKMGHWWARRRARLDLASKLSAPSVDGDAVDATLARAMVARVLGSPAFVKSVVQGVVEEMSDEVPAKVADRLARDVMDSAGDRLAEAVAGRIADAWQRAARTCTAAAGNGWTLRPRQRGSPSRGRNPKA